MRFKQTDNHLAVGDRGVLSMCDYSLDFVVSRPAKVGDKLVSTQFSNSFTRGFAAVGEPNVAVCLLPGTEVAFEKEVEYARGLFPSWNCGKKLGVKVAQFQRINENKPNVHHDALEFPDGDVVLLHSLRDGQHATVLQLPAALRTAEKAEEQSASLH
jgi:hypothetical protein